MAFWHLSPRPEVSPNKSAVVLRLLAAQGVSVVARLSRNLEELALVERRLDELPYPNLRLVQVGQVLLLAAGAGRERQD